MWDKIHSPRSVEKYIPDLFEVNMELQQTALDKVTGFFVQIPHFGSPDSVSMLGCGGRTVTQGGNFTPKRL